MDFVSLKSHHWARPVELCLGFVLLEATNLPAFRRWAAAEGREILAIACAVNAQTLLHRDKPGGGKTLFAQGQVSLSVV